MAEAASAAVIQKEKKRLPFLVEVVVRLVKEKPLGTIGGVIVLIFFIVGIACMVTGFLYGSFFANEKVLEPLSEKVIAGEVRPGDRVRVDFVDGALEVHTLAAAAYQRVIASPQASFTARSEARVSVAFSAAMATRSFLVPRRGTLSLSGAWALYPLAVRWQE